MLEARRLEWLEIYRRQRFAVRVFSADFVLCWFKPFRRGERWFLHRWRVGWDKQQRGIVIETPVCRLEVVRTWIPF